MFQHTLCQIARIVTIFSLLLPFFLAVMCWGGVCSAADKIISFYVSNSGDDKNIGTAAKPFKTIGMAQEAIRNSRSNGIGKRYVFLRSGTYEITEPLKFGPLDGGTKKFSVTFAASTGEKAVISTGRKIIGWTLLENAGESGNADIIVADVPYLVQPIEAKPAEGDTPEQLAVPGVKWEFEELIANKKPAIRVEFAASPSPQDTLTEPGSWCLDVENQKIFYRLRKKETADTIEVFVPITQQVAIIAGDKENEEPVQNLHFRNLHFVMPGTEAFTSPALEFIYSANCTATGCSFDIFPNGETVRFDE